jgi:hypothetical protein
LQTTFTLLLKDDRIKKNLVRFVLITDNQSIKAIDTKTGEQIETNIESLTDHVTFFLPLAGMEKYATAEENDADVKAAVQMAKLYDEIKKTNPTDTPEQVHQLNVFLSRLLFCFFAEDTGIFSDKLFTRAPRVRFNCAPRTFHPPPFPPSQRHVHLPIGIIPLAFAALMIRHRLMAQSLRTQVTPLVTCVQDTQTRRGLADFLFSLRHSQRGTSRREATL